MTVHTSKLILTLVNQLNELATRISTENYVQKEPSLFDCKLFATRSNLLADYLSESRVTLNQLTGAVDQKSTKQVVWLAQRLIDQITAITRELITQNMRHEHYFVINSANNYNCLAKYREYERRLLAMISDRNILREVTTNHILVHKLQQEINTLKWRLVRCRQALIHIERQIK